MKKLLLLSAMLVCAIGLRAQQTTAEEKGIAFKAWKAITAKQGAVTKKTCPADCTVSYTDYEEPSEAYFVENNVSCFKLKRGGWAVYHSHVDGAEGTPGFYDFASYTYKSGALKKADLLPVPAVSELLDKEKCAGKENLVEKIKKCYSQRPKDFLRYEFYAENKSVDIRLTPLDLEAEMEQGNFTEECFELIKSVEYHWDGERFSR